MSAATEAHPLDRSNPLPLWAQLDADIRRRLRGGAFDERFPGELELAAEYEVSRQTVRDALRRLREEGVLASGRGRGTWIRRTHITQPLGALYSLYNSVEEAGLEHRTVVRALEVCIDEQVAARLGRPADVELVYLERLRLADGEPLALDKAWLPRSIAGPLLDADFTHSGLYAELASLTGTRPTGGSESISAAVPSPAVRRLLRLPGGTALMQVLRIGRLRDQAIEWREMMIRGDRFSVAAEWSTQEGYRMTVAGASRSARRE
ncbi:MAG: GntR family transcriptional regulator [Pseudonocardia sp. SCN 72-86]|nr:MAG: GntR family transcriptional regulator [Pseudonocardia sp. SCN 72-86]